MSYIVFENLCGTSKLVPFPSMRLKEFDGLERFGCP